MFKRVIDPLTGLSLAMKVEDRGSDATIIIMHNGNRIETKVTGSGRALALTAYGARDVETFGSLFDPPSPAHIRTGRIAA